jgi:hypothetical protein
MTLNNYFTDAIARARLREKIKGTVGYLDPATNQYAMDVPGRNGYVFVRTVADVDGFGGVVSAVKSTAAVANKMPVIVTVSQGSAEIDAPDHSLLGQWNSGNGFLGAVGKHSHRIGFGMPDIVEGMRFEPGLVRPFREADNTFGMRVYITSFFYEYQGDLIHFPGQPYDLTSFIPGTSGKKAWVVVGVDPTDNTPIAVKDTEYVSTLAMSPTMLSGFDFSRHIPLMALVLRNGQTAINTMKTFVDARPYVGGSPDRNGEFALMASEGWPATTNGCATLAKTEHGTNDIDLQTFDFDNTANEIAQWTTWMPGDWDGGTITATFTWTAASSSGDVIWGIQCRAYANDDAIDQAWSTTQTVTDTLTATDDICVTSATSAITVVGNPAGGALVHFRVYRDAVSGSDTLAADARLIGVKINYTK